MGKYRNPVFETIRRVVRAESCRVALNRSVRFVSGVRSRDVPAMVRLSRRRILGSRSGKMGVAV